MTGVHYLTRKQVDDGRWNGCIDKSLNGLIYARTEYLDRLAGNWDALVSGDYDCVMPLTGNKKFGAGYLYQPAFCQQLGIIGECGIVALQAFLDKAMEIFPFAEINFNYSNEIKGASVHNNFILDLGSSYEDISGRYSNDLKKNLQRSKQSNLEYRSSENVRNAVSIYQKTYGKRFPHVRDGHYRALENFCLSSPKNYLVREVSLGGNLLSTVLCLTDSKRIYFLASTTLPEGRKREANHLLVDRMIREYSGKPLLLDFEGSDITGIADFYKNFGAVNQPYPGIAWNRLKWPWSMFKK
jgi:hypothetical protein